MFIAACRVQEDTVCGRTLFAKVSTHRHFVPGFMNPIVENCDGNLAKFLSKGVGDCFELGGEKSNNPNTESARGIDQRFSRASEA